MAQRPVRAQGRLGRKWLGVGGHHARRGLHRRRVVCRLVTEGDLEKVGHRNKVRPSSPYSSFRVFKQHYRVSDSDGEFLLIEAAEVLPPWVTPSNAENRVRTNS